MTDKEHVYTVEETVGLEHPKDFCELAWRSCRKIDCVSCREWLDECGRKALTDPKLSKNDRKKIESALKKCDL